MLEFVTDKSFDLDKTYEYILSIQVNLDGFSFSVVCPEENKLMVFKSTLLKISTNSLIARHFKEWVKSEELLQKPYRKTRIVVFSNKFTLLPKNYSTKELKYKIPKLLFEENSELEIAENIIDKLNSLLIFALPTGLNRVIREEIGECEIMHPVKIASNQFPVSENGSSLLLIFDSTNFYITLFNKNDILFTNSFKQEHANDVVYYLLTVLKQLEIEAKTTQLFYAGKLNNEDKIINILKKYFSSIDILSGENPIQNCNIILSQRVHHNFTLFN